MVVGVAPVTGGDALAHAAFALDEGHAVVSQGVVEPSVNEAGEAVLGEGLLLDGATVLGDALVARDGRDDVLPAPFVGALEDAEEGG